MLLYAKYLMKQGLKIGILVYDHGAMNVDLPLLNELRGEKCELETIAASCDADCHRRRFRTKLVTMAMCGYDRVIIEPSGVFDMDEFFDTLQESPLDSRYEAGSMISVVDARLEENFSEQEDFFLASQASCAGMVLLSKVQMASLEEIERTLVHLRKAESKIGCRQTSDDRLLIRDWSKLNEDDFSRLMNCGYSTPEYVKVIAGEETDFQSLSFLNLTLEGDALREKVLLFFSDLKYGRVLRVKGFFREGERWYQLNATAQGYHSEAVPDARSAIIVIGSSLNEDEISKALTGKIPEHRIL